MNGIFQAPGPEGWDAYEITFTGRDPHFRPTNREPEGYFIPGFVDLHIHGAFGIDFMSATSEELNELAELLKKEGYAGFFPTTITYDFESTKRAIDSIPSHPLIWGYHLEGPFISADFPGAQPLEAIAAIPTGPSPWDEFFQYAGPMRLITLAPEQPNALAFIQKLSDLGVIVSGGHTNATYAEFQSAIEVGLSHATHTYNAMRGLHHREAGALGAVLNHDSVTAELIYDRQHVSKPAAEILLKAKPHNKVVAVSDCTLAKGKQTGEQFEMWGHQVIKGETDVRLTSNNALAGSCATLLDCFRFLCEDFGPEIATNLCSLNPRRELDYDHVPDCWILLDNDLNLQTF